MEILQQTQTVVLPDLTKVTIREQNGNDDEVLSLIANNKDDSAITKFLLGIITSDNPATSKKYTFDELRDWKANNTSYLLLASRVFSLGPILEVMFTCPTCGKVHELPFEEELTKYIPPMDKPTPKVGEPGYFKYACVPYPDTAKSRELILSSKKIIRYDYSLAKDEAKLLAIPEDVISVNTALRLRNLSLKQAEGKWLRLERFDVFTAKDMVEIRKDIFLNDPQFTPVSEYQCQDPKCKAVHKLNIMAQPNFFFPGVIL